MNRAVAHAAAWQERGKALAQELETVQPGSRLFPALTEAFSATGWDRIPLRRITSTEGTCLSWRRFYRRRVVITRREAGTSWELSIEFWRRGRLLAVLTETPDRLAITENGVSHDLDRVSRAALYPLLEAR